MKRTLCVLLLLVLIAMSLSACRQRDVDEVDTGVAVPEAVTPLDSSPSAPETTTDSSVPTDSDDGPLDVDAIEKELEAIQRELDNTALPDDSDFAEIEDGL